MDDAKEQLLKQFEALDLTVLAQLSLYIKSAQATIEVRQEQSKPECSPGSTHKWVPTNQAKFQGWPNKNIGKRQVIFRCANCPKKIAVVPQYYRTGDPVTSGFDQYHISTLDRLGRDFHR